ncbi:MAG: ABC transporter substrate-binding protein [Dehalococcoidia bacterium]|nr:ABC transporter substrate-binding protein [Dehalococcoidia bacterium]
MTISPALRPSRPLRRRAILAAPAAFGAAGALAALSCGGDDAQDAPASTSSPTAAAPTGPRGALTLALVTLADQSADPHVTRVANLAPITTSCFEQFSRWDANGQLVPALAGRMEETPDHAQLTFHLRPDATFWDGTPVTAEDAKWSFERYIAVKPGDTYQATVANQVESVAALDARTVVVRMRQPSTLRLSFGIINPRGWNVASRAHYERTGEDAFRAAPMCSGPFRLVRSEPGEFVELEAHAGHYERPPHVQSLRMDVVPEQATRVAQLRTGEADFIDGIASPAREQLTGAQDVRIFESESAALTTLYFQEPDAWPYRDIRVRRALQLATDQAALAATLLGGHGRPAPAAHIFPVTRGYDAAMFPAQPFDAARARALVSEAGAEGARVKLWGYDSSSAPQIPAMLQAVAGMWRAAGLDVEVETMEAGAYLQRYAAHQLGGITALASGAWFDGESLLRTDYLAGQPYSPPTTAAISDAITALAGEFDERRRIAGIQAVYRTILDEAWSVTLPYANTAWAVRSDRVAAWEPSLAWAYPHAFETLRAAAG